MHLLFSLGHPAHFHLFKNAIKELKKKNHKISILIKKKDVLENLLIGEGYDYLNILPKGRKDNKVSIGMGLLKRDYKLLLYCKQYKPDLMIGTSPEITHIGKLLNIPSIVNLGWWIFLKMMLTRYRSLQNYLIPWLILY